MVYIANFAHHAHVHGGAGSPAERWQTCRSACSRSRSSRGADATDSGVVRAQSTAVALIRQLSAPNTGFKHGPTRH